MADMGKMNDWLGDIPSQQTRRLMQKSKGITIETFLKTAGMEIWYHNAPQYWIHSHLGEYVPRVEYLDSNEESSELQEKKLGRLRET